MQKIYLSIMLETGRTMEIICSSVEDAIISYKSILRALGKESIYGAIYRIEGSFETHQL